MSHSPILVYGLTAAYGVLVLIPIIQLFRIFKRVPELGWTTQKLFLFLTMLSSLVRCAFFAVVPYLDQGNFFMENFEEPAFTILDTLPGALYFSTYTLLILFWAEIIHHARNQSISFPQKLRPIFMTINVLVYLFLGAFWLLLYFLSSSLTQLLDILLNVYMAIIYLGAALGFIVYGGRLYLMLKQFPIESRGRQSKLKEVGWVTVICTTVFSLRALLLLVITFVTQIELNDIFIAVYYALVEVIPALLVLYVLRKLPPRRTDARFTTPYQRLDPNQSERSEYRPSVETND